jgi:hypothetical protein
VAVVASTSLLLFGVTFVAATAASAVGTNANSISVGSAPSAGSTRGTYTPSASAKSGDKVAVTIDKTSSGCSVSSGKVTFTGSGICVVDFNDSGNSSYASAAQVTQSIKVYSSNDITLSTPPKDGSAGGSYSPGATATSGDYIVETLSKSSSGCSVSSGRVTFTGSGTCLVDFNDPGNGAFAAAAQVGQDVKVYSSNTIYPSVPPAAGTINGTYTASASATSGDAVSIGLDGGSTGCTIDKNIVTFTDNGVCRVDFNDHGNGAFAAANQVQQAISSGSGGPKGQATLTLTSIGETSGDSLTLTSSGGSGTGAVTYAVTSAGSAHCSIKGDTLRSSRSGTCTVTVTKAADSTYSLARSAVTTVTISAHYPKAVRMSASVWTGRTVKATIIGSGFYGQPRILSSAAGTKVSVSGDSGRTLTIHVTVSAHAVRGIHTFTLVFARGERTSLRYNQR